MASTGRTETAGFSDGYVPSEHELGDEGPEDAEGPELDDGPLHPDFDEDTRDLGGTDSEAAEDVRRNSPQPRGEDGKFEPKDGKKKRETAPEKRQEPEDEEAEIRRMLREDSERTGETDEQSGQPRRTKGVDEGKKKGKDAEASKDPAETESGETTDDGNTEQAPTKLSRKQRRDAENALLLDKWTKAEIALLSDAALAKAAEKATERHAETKRLLEQERQNAKKTKDAAQRKGGTTEDDEADDETVEDVADEDAALHAMAEEAYAGFNDPTGNFKKAVTGHTKKVIAHLRAEFTKDVEDMHAEFREQFKTVLRDLVEEFNFNNGTTALRSRFGKHLKDKAALDSLRKTARALQPHHPTYQQALEAAAMSMWGREAIERDARRQEKVTDAQRRGSGDLTSRGRVPVGADEDDDESIIRRSLRRGPDGSD